MLVRDESGLRLAMGLEPSSGNRAIRGGLPVGIYYRRPTTRMGVVWETRKAFYEAKEYGERKTIDPETRGDAALEVLLRALNGELLVRTTARAEQDIRTALRLAEEFGYRTLVEEATDAWLCADDLAASGVAVLVGSPSGSAGERDGAELRFHTLTMLAERGVPFAICTGSDESALPLRYEAMFAVRFGLTPDAALEAITRRPAEILDIADRAGALAPGLDADLVVWSGDPFDPTTAVEAVYVRGRKAAP
jgi:imidazolonepropionase-like amidohydrolase